MVQWTTYHFLVSNPRRYAGTQPREVDDAVEEKFRTLVGMLEQK